MRKSPRFSAALVCASCSKTVIKTAASQIYCRPCSASVDLERKRKWQAKQPPKPLGTVTLQKRRCLAATRREEAALRSKEASHSLVSSLCSEINRDDLAWYVRFAVPYSKASSKNSIWSLAKGGAHVFLRKASNDYRNAIIAATKAAITRSGIIPSTNKVWIDIFVQKSTHKSDAINVVDLICDGLKVGLGVDDKWFSIRMLDWEIVKSEPQIFIGIGQADTFEAQSCSHCGAIKRLSEFALRNKNLGTPSRVCLSCTDAGRTGKPRKPVSHRVPVNTHQEGAHVGSGHRP